MPKVAMVGAHHMLAMRWMVRGWWNRVRRLTAVMTLALGKRWGRGIQWGWGNICDLPGYIDLRSQLFFNLGTV